MKRTPPRYTSLHERWAMIRGVGLLTLGGVALLLLLPHCIVGGALCQSDKDCFVGSPKCIAGSCRACVADGDCEIGLHCVANACINSGTNSESSGLPDQISTSDQPPNDRTNAPCQDGETRPCYTQTEGCTAEENGTFRCTSPCKAGEETCVNQRWSGVCNGELHPTQEECNGVDDDCNGKIDDNVKGLGNACSVPNAKGECAKGTYTACNDGKLTCVSSHSPQTEICNNGLDDDCNGQIDETPPCFCSPGAKEECYQGSLGCSKQGDAFVCKGTCQVGTRICSEHKSWGACQGEVGPTAEICDGKDNDCNGQTDEDFPEKRVSCPVVGQQGECAQGTASCVNGALVCTQTTMPTSEICDGKDNDCNGQIDDNCTSCTPTEQQFNFTSGGWSSSGGAVAFDPNHKTFVIGSNALGWKSLYTGQDIRTFVGSTFFSAAFSPNGNLLATADGQSVKVWDLITGKATLQFNVNDAVLVAFRPDGKALGAVSYDVGDSDPGDITVWELPSGNVLRTIRAPSIEGAAFHPGLTQVAIRSRQNVQIYDLATGNTLTTLSGTSSAGAGMAFSPNGKMLAVGHSRGTVVLWDIAQGMQVRTFSVGNGDIVALVFDPAGQFLAVAVESALGLSSSVQILSLATGNALTSFSARNVTNLAFRSDGQYFGVTDRNGGRVWVCPCTPGATRSCYSGPSHTQSVGACKNGTQTCQTTKLWGPCQGEVTPQREIADNLDNDCDGQVDEATPDLIVSQITLSPTKGKPGASVQVQVCISNSGIGGTSPFKVRLYRSSNSGINASDTPLTGTPGLPADISFTSQAGGATATCKTATVAFPSNVYTTSYIGAMVDFDEQIDEFDENNNTASTQFTVEAPDLQISTFTIAPTSGKTGSKIVANVCTVNRGTDTAGAFKVRLYFSTNSTINTADTALTGTGGSSADISYTSMAVGAAPNCKSISVTVPTATPGTRYIGAWADYQSQVSESSETNNTASAAIAIDGPDLQVSSIAFSPTAAKAGGAVSVNVCIVNAGTIAAGSFSVRLYYSSTSSVTTNSTALTGASMPLPADLSFTSLPVSMTPTCRVSSITLPTTAIVGTRYIGAIVDFQNQVPETNDSNNTRAGSLSIQ